MPYHELIGNNIHITHDCGFFSCCSIRLDAIVEYFNKNNFNLPEKVDSTKSYTWYKKNKNDDIYDFFVCYENIDNIVFISVNISILFNFPCVIRPSLEHLTINAFF